MAVGSIFAVGLELTRRLGVSSSQQPLSALIVLSALGLVAGLIHELRALYRLVVWAFFGAVVGLYAEAILGPQLYYAALRDGLYYSLFFGLIGEMALRMIGGKLPLIEHLSWSWKQARSSIVQGLVGGVVFAVAYNVPNWMSERGSSSLTLSLSQAIVLGLFFGVVLGVFFSLSVGLVSGLRITSNLIISVHTKE